MHQLNHLLTALCFAALTLSCGTIKSQESMNEHQKPEANTGKNYAVIMLNINNEAGYNQYKKKQINYLKKLAVISNGNLTLWVKKEISLVLKLQIELLL